MVERPTWLTPCMVERPTWLTPRMAKPMGV
jgi:hypothetical protein